MGRKLRKKPPKHPFLRLRHQSEETKPPEEFSTTSESESSSDESYECLRSVSARASLHSFQEKTSDLSEISEDEDAINVDVMREFKQFDNMQEQTETNGT